MLVFSKHALMYGHILKTCSHVVKEYMVMFSCSQNMFSFLVIFSKRVLIVSNRFSMFSKHPAYAAVYTAQSQHTANVCTDFAWEAWARTCS